MNSKSICHFFGRSWHAIKEKGQKFYDSLLKVLRIRPRETFFQHLLQIFFLLSMIVKAFDGFVEIVSGIALIFLQKTEILKIALKTYDFLNVPKDLALQWISHLSEIFTEYFRVFVIIMLLLNGIIKLVLAVNLILKKLWAFHLGVVLLSLLVIYETVEAVLVKSIALGILTGFDYCVLLVIWREYFYVKKYK